MTSRVAVIRTRILQIRKLRNQEAGNFLKATPTWNAVAPNSQSGIQLKAWEPLLSDNFAHRWRILSVTHISSQSFQKCACNGCNSLLQTHKKASFDSSWTLGGILLHFMVMETCGSFSEVLVFSSRKLLPQSHKGLAATELCLNSHLAILPGSRIHYIHLTARHTWYLHLYKANKTLHNNENLWTVYAIS